MINKKDNKDIYREFFYKRKFCYVVIRDDLWLVILDNLLRFLI